MNSFFDKNYRTPLWFKRKISRRNALKVAAGATAIAAMPKVFAESKVFNSALKADPWLTLNAVLEHLLPSSDSGPGAKELHISHYLYNVVHHQPVSEEEKNFIKKGVGWLNGYSQSQLNKKFIDLSKEQKEKTLQAISRSQAGENWLNTLINYIFEASLSAPAYGGNPDGKGWQWLEHQAGFPLPVKGKLYYELPSSRNISVKQIPVEEKRKS